MTYPALRAWYPDRAVEPTHRSAASARSAESAGFLDSSVSTRGLSWMSIHHSGALGVDRLRASAGILGVKRVEPTGGSNPPYARMLLPTRSGRPIDPGRSHRCTEWMSLVVGQAQSRHELAGTNRSTQQLWIDSVEHQLCPAEHSERALLVDGAPGQVNKSATARALDLRAPDVDTVLGRNRSAVQLPNHRRGIGRVQLVQLVGAAALLHGYMNVVVSTGRIEARVAIATR
jgi:hypothetical protein